MLVIFLWVMRVVKMLFTSANPTEGFLQALAMAHFAAMKRYVPYFCWWEKSPGRRQWTSACRASLGKGT